MMLSEYIDILLQLQAEHGPMLEVEKWMPAKGRHSAPTPVIAYARTYDRACTHAFYDPRHDTEVQKGDPVVRV